MQDVIARLISATSRRTGGTVRQRANDAIERNPDHKRRVLRHLRARQHADACKLKAEEYFAGQMGMTLAQWQRAQWGVRGLR